jgi:hypothetical protein
MWITTSLLIWCATSPRRLLVSSLVTLRPRHDAVGLIVFCTMIQGDGIVDSYHRIACALGDAAQVIQDRLFLISTFHEKPTRQDGGRQV